MNSDLSILLTRVSLTTLALVAGGSVASGQTHWLTDDFDDGIVTWDSSWQGQITEAEQRLVISGSFGPLPTNNPVANSATAIHTIELPTGPLPDQQEIELRADLVGANRNDAWAGLEFVWDPDIRGYTFWKDQDEVGLVKFSNGATSFAWFFYEKRQLKNENVTLALSLTRVGSEVKINTRVLDKEHGNAVLFDRTVTDTPQADPVLPDGAARGQTGVADVQGTPWPVVSVPSNVGLVLLWADPASTTEDAAEVTFDNVEVLQSEAPQLAIQPAVVVSWPLTQGQFALECAPSMSGPWTPVPDQWSRTNADQIQVSLLVAPGDLRLFRLRR